MCTETKEAILSLYKRIQARRRSAVKARNAIALRTNASFEGLVMLAGKVKAYTDILCLIADRYERKLPSEIWREK